MSTEQTKDVIGSSVILLCAILNLMSRKIALLLNFPVLWKETVIKMGIFSLYSCCLRSFLYPPLFFKDVCVFYCDFLFIYRGKTWELQGIVTCHTIFLWKIGCNCSI